MWSRADDLPIPELGAQQLNQLGTSLAIVEPFRRGPDGPGGIRMLRLLVLEERKKLGIGPAGGRPFGLKKLSFSNNGATRPSMAFQPAKFSDRHFSGTSFSRLSESAFKKSGVSSFR